VRQGFQACYLIIRDVYVLEISEAAQAAELFDVLVVAAESQVSVVVSSRAFPEILQ